MSCSRLPGCTRASLVRGRSRAHEQFTQAHAGGRGGAPVKSPRLEAAASPGLSAQALGTGDTARWAPQATQPGLGSVRAPSAARTGTAAPPAGPGQSIAPPSQCQPNARLYRDSRSHTAHPPSPQSRGPSLPPSPASPVPHARGSEDARHAPCLSTHFSVVIQKEE